MLTTTEDFHGGFSGRCHWLDEAATGAGRRMKDNFCHHTGVPDKRVSKAQGRKSVSVGCCIFGEAGGAATGNRGVKFPTCNCVPEYIEYVEYIGNQHLVAAGGGVFLGSLSGRRR